MPDESFLTDPKHKRGDYKLLTTAVRNHWDIPDEIYKALPLHVLKDATQDPDGRVRNRAREILLEMNKQNTAAPPTPHNHLHLHQLPQVDDDLNAAILESAARLAAMDPSSPSAPTNGIADTNGHQRDNGTNGSA